MIFSDDQDDIILAMVVGRVIWLFGHDGGKKREDFFLSKIKKKHFLTVKF